MANATTAAFITMVGSEFVQKYLGEGPRMVRDVFRLARENSPAIVFIDEIDSIATKRFDAQTGADREVWEEYICVYIYLHKVNPCNEMHFVLCACRCNEFCWSC